MARLDTKLVEKEIFETRAKAQSAIKDGIVFCNGKCITKNAYDVTDDDLIEIKGEVLKYVSRGGLKLEKAINSFKITLDNKIMCDIGSSTGGFSDCALQNNIKKIYAIDVGSNQFHRSLRSNPKILLFENTDFRDIDLLLLKDVQIVTIDVSFISVKKLVPRLKLLTNLDEIICLIKPQFECGKEKAHKYKGVVLHKEIHFEIIKDIIVSFSNIGFNIQGLTFSPIRGGNGNIEYLIYVKKASETKKIDIKEVIDNAFCQTM